MFSSNRLMYALLGLVILIIIGMLTASWRVILYPYLFVIGISILLGLTKTIQTKRHLIWVPFGVTALYLVLYVWLDVISLKSPTGGTGYVLGMVPTTAIFLLGIWPTAILVSLLYAWIFPEEGNPLNATTESQDQEMNV